MGVLVGFLLLLVMGAIGFAVVVGGPLFGWWAVTKGAEGIRDHLEETKKP